MAFNKILVTLDGSTLAESALQFAESAAAPKASITLLSVMEEDWTASLAMASVTGTAVTLPANPRNANDPHALAETRDYLDGVARAITRTGMTAKSEIRSGSVVEAILEEAKQGYDLLVMATHGRSGLGKMLLGSVVSDVLRYAPCPVLVIPPSRH